MIKIELDQLVDWLEEESGQRITIGEIAEKSGIHRNILSRMLNKPEANTSSEHLDKLAQFFFYEFQTRAPHVFDGGEMAEELIMENIISKLVRVFPEKAHHAEFLEMNPKMTKAMDVGALWEVYTNFQRSSSPPVVDKKKPKTSSK